MNIFKRIFSNSTKILMCVLCLLLVTLCSCDAKEIEKVTLRHAAKELKNKHFEEVGKIFSEMGFEDIELIPLGDIKLGLFAKENEVADVFIGSNNSFKVGEDVDKNSKITIKYHSKKQEPTTVAETITEQTNRIAITFSSNELIGKERLIVTNKFEDVGFTNIKYSTIKEDKLDKIGTVAEVTINGLSEFKKGNLFDKNAIVRITYYGNSIENVQSTQKIINNEIKENETLINPEVIDENDYLEIKSSNEINGTWVQTNVLNNYSYFAAIDEKTMTIYLYNADSDTESLYWTGTFTNSIDISSKQNIISKNYKYITDYLLNASHANEKEFIYENSEIKFNAIYNGTNEDIILKKYTKDFVETISYSEDRISGYDKTNNNIIEFDNLLISYPTYFDSKDEVSTDKTLIYFPKDENAMADFVIDNIVLDDVITQENLLEVAENVVNSYESVNEIKDIKYNIENEVPCVTVLSSSGIGLRLDAFYLVDNKSNIVDIIINFDFRDKSLNDYIGDFNKIVENIKFNSHQDT